MPAAQSETMSIAPSQTASQVVARHGVSWDTFQALARESSGGRLAYDRGTLEIMSPSFNHENVAGLLGRWVEIYTEEVGIEIGTSRSTTLSLPEAARAIEADESFYLASADRIRGNAEIDLSVDPPPDLVIEVDVTNSSLNKLDICRSLGIPEVWRFKDERIEVYVLQNDQQYALHDQSSVLPGFPLAGAIDLLSRRQSLGENEMAKLFRALVRDADSNA